MTAAGVLRRAARRTMGVWEARGIFRLLVGRDLKVR